MEVSNVMDDKLIVQKFLDCNSLEFLNLMRDILLCIIISALIFVFSMQAYPIPDCLE